MKQLSAELISNMVSWRHHIHQRPEIAFDVVETAAFVSESLKSAGIEVHEALAKLVLWAYFVVETTLNVNL